MEIGKKREIKKFTDVPPATFFTKKVNGCLDPLFLEEKNIPDFYYKINGGSQIINNNLAIIFLSGIIEIFNPNEEVEIIPLELKFKLLDKFHPDYTGQLD